LELIAGIPKKVSITDGMTGLYVVSFRVSTEMLTSFA
jgi:hypothetical protein